MNRGVQISSQIVATATNLPANIEELARFVLVGREKLVSVRAEIRAIDKLNLAEEVRTQKKEEAMMLSEALLDAEVRIGELTRVLPRSVGGRPEKTILTSGDSFKGKTCDSSVDSFAGSEYKHTRQQCCKCDSWTDFQKSTVRTFENTPKPKLEVIKNLGFNRQQVERFETLANNPDIVEQVKAEARENDDLPTRSRVLQLVKEKKKAEQPLQVDRQEIKKIVNAIVNASNVPTDSELLKGWVNEMQDDDELGFNLMMIDDAIEKFQTIKAFMTKNRR